MTLKALRAWLESEQGLTVSISAIDKFLRQQLGYRYKKTVIARARARGYRCCVCEMEHI